MQFTRSLSFGLSILGLVYGLVQILPSFVSIILGLVHGLVQILPSVSIILSLLMLVVFLRFLLPRNLIPNVSRSLIEAMDSLELAESTGVIPRLKDYRSDLVICANELLQIRMESHRAPGILRQLRLAIWYGLTYRLYKLSSRVLAIKRRIELTVDGRQLTSLTSLTGTQSTITTIRYYPDEPYGHDQ